MYSQIFLIVLFLTQCSYSTITQECFCNQMYTLSDCQRKNNCEWDNTQEMCVKQENNQTPDPPKPQTQSQIPPETIFPSYCGQFTTNDVCASMKPCEWNGKTCSHFTSCTAYTYNNEQDCQKVSDRCSTDGVHCIEKTNCLEYKTKQACYENNDGKFCIWNEKCEDANSCDKLPQKLTSDAQCRAQISICTAKLGGGCIESGINCSNQVSEIGCVSNKNQSKTCFWNENKCYDRTCELAPNNLVTDKDCKEFLSICTTKQGGGCIIRSQCNDANTAEACVTDVQNQLCFWNGDSCHIKVCEDAPSNLLTNLDCNNFLDNCITNGNGCINNTGCEAAIIEVACDKSPQGQKCHWDGTECKLKKCENAGPNYIGHESCNNYMSTCTAQVGAEYGCTEISCLSAPLINNTNNQCELYLPGNNCITKLGGGCRVNTSCSDINIEIACIKDIHNKTCFWHEGKCYLKTCDNAPSTYNTNKLCSDFLESCSYGDDMKCIDKVCENVDNQEDCTFDYYMNPCVMQSSCKAKQCNIASKSIITHSDCQDYLPTCTLDNSGSGCMDIPDQCSQIIINDACKINKSKSKCGWNGSSCIDYICTTASNDMNTTSKCQQYKNGCVVNNTLNGCMDLPDDCSNRLKQDNCEIYVGSVIKCQWNIIDKICINISCENAHKTTQLTNVTQNGCWNYFGLHCIISVDGKSCLQRPSNCLGLGKDACQQSQVLSDNSDCYWDILLSICKIKACSSITGVIINHDACFNIMNNCTINQSLDGCIELKSCDLYNTELQCVIDTNNNSCAWNGNDNTCGSKLCSNADESPQYTSDSACQLFSKNCTASQKLCSLKKSRCEDYRTQSACEQNTINNLEQCIWMVGICNLAPFECKNIKGSGLTPQYCYSLNTLCSANVAGTSCIINYGSCMMYQEQDCLWGNIEGYCAWNGSQCELDCSVAPGPLYDIDYCFSYNFACTAKLDGSGCVKMQMFCASTLPQNCTKATEGYCYKNNGSCVSSSMMPLTNCASVTGVRLPIEYCQMISMFSCGINTSFTSCVPISYFCSAYSQTDCVATIAGKCIFQSGACIDMPFSADICGSIVIDGLSQYTDFHCNQYQPYVCIANDTKNGCKLKPTDAPVTTSAACNSYTGTNLTYQYCVSKSSLCSVNLAKTSCVDSKQLCNEYSTSECYYAVKEGECTVYQNQCIQKSCDNAPLTAIDTAGCQAYSTNCISSVGGCQTRSICTSYIKQSACVKSLDGKDCLWNPTVGKCVNKTCASAENTTNFNSDSICSTLGNCTVKATGLGCMSRNFCGSYSIQEQCKLNDKGIACVWNTNNPSLPVCTDKICSSAPFTINNHQDCITYLSGCTVNLVNSIPKGCTNFLPCIQYKSEDQCRISSEKDLNNNNIICDWNGSVCGNKSCLTANNTYNTHSKCSNYYLGCTVNSTNNGCIRIPNTCESMNEFQCFDGSVDSSNNQCMWMNDQCITKTCLNSPKSDNENDCESHLSSCTLSFFSCKTSICEEFQLTTESECQNALPNGQCTSNGSSCVQKINCSDSKTELGCTVDKQGKECQWVTNNDGTNQCSLKSCETAPKSLKTEEECIEYYHPEDGSTCTAKVNGGCIIKGDCNTLSIDTLCIKDKKGNPCIWDTETQSCRYPSCKDLSGQSFKECNTANNKCGIGLNGKCANLTKCEDIKNRNICIQGSNGPCLWIQEFKNADQTYGACFPYEQCSSLNWTTNEQCKLISPNCTTNGKQCIGITTCNETNTQGGCITGTDGVCIQTPVAKDSKDLICKKFTFCNDAYYLTHDECYKANNSCTSDYQNGCIYLSDCSKYTIEGQCIINQIGIVKNEIEQPTSTGKCVWDKNANSCKDQTCKDISLTTELACSQVLKDCTSDGINCLQKGNCVTYLTKEACQNAGGIDGICFWVEAVSDTLAQCRLKICSDILDGNSNLQCSEVSNCISDGTKCIEKSQCSSYVTQPACLSTGTDGVCVWNSEKCSLMTQCSDALSESYCSQAKNRCFWSPKQKCENHTCETYQTQENKCTFYFSFDMKNYNFCALQAGKCKEIDPIAFNEDQCYQMSGNLYSWNPYFEKCIQCEKKLINGIDTDNQENVTLFQNKKDYFWIAMAYLAISEAI